MAIKAFDDMTHEERMERLEELKQVRIEYLQDKALDYYRKYEASTEQLDRADNFRQFMRYTEMLYLEKHGNN